MRKISAISALFCSLVSSAQNDLKPYQWRDHLPYNQAFSVTSQGNNRIIAAASECAFAYNKDAGTFDRLNKVYGYSDIEPVIVRNNPYNNALVIVYKNSNIDIVKNGTITNASDLLRKQNIGDKTVNSVTFNGPYAYLACNFGIVVFNTDANEVKDTYIIGPNATNLQVYQVALSNTDIYAATKSGLYKASLSSPNLSSYTSWSKITGIPNGPYNAVAFFGGKVITNFSKKILSNTGMADTLLQYDGTSWGKYTSKLYIAGTYEIHKLIVSPDNTQLLITDQWGFESYNAAGSNVARIWDFNLGWTPVLDIVPDPTETDFYWVATAEKGLLKAKAKTGQNNADTVNIYSVNGPTNSSAGSFAFKDDKLIVAPSYVGFDMFNNYLQSNVFHFLDNTWGESVTPPAQHDTIFDIISVAFDNNDKNHYYATTWWNGVKEYINDEQVARYDCQNTGNQLHIIDTYVSGFPLTRTAGLTMDKDNNLWVGMGETNYLLSVKKSDNTWTSLNFASIINLQNVYPRISHVIVDSSKQVWAVAYSVGLFVYKFDGSFTQPNPANAKKLTNTVNSGGLPSNEVICVAEDKSGDIWVGTDKGIYVFYNPESIFSQTSGWDAQPIYIEQDGKTQLLLQTDNVVCISVDGANNKWCGTRASGLYCFSPDGQKELFHFTVDNSPLFSNNIADVKVNPKTGEVFVATDKGVLSFQNIIIDGFEDFRSGGVYAYPNPVKPGFEGPIIIHGMIDGATVKIIDAGGNFVYQTTSKGGQATWDGKRFNGSRASNGVYMVICSTPDASDRVMTKILLQN
ncbi:MAG: type IX secretion system anionic LPS delivery protein PorZ [Bacteroidia bacterium]